jgi:hypothetical protein
VRSACFRVISTKTNSPIGPARSVIFCWFHARHGQANVLLVNSMTRLAAPLLACALAWGNATNAQGGRHPLGTGA